MYSRRRQRGRRRVMIAAAVAAVAVTVWWFWPQRSAPNESLTQESKAEAVPAERQSETGTSAFTDSSLSDGLNRRTTQPRTTPSQDQPGREEDSTSAPTLVMGQPIPSLSDGRSKSNRSSGNQQEADRSPLLAGKMTTMAADEPSAPSQPAQLSTGNPAVDRLIRDAMRSMQSQPIQSRLTLSQALHSPQLSEAQRHEIRSVLTALNQMMVFEPIVVPGDPFAMKYTIQSGDYLQKIVRTTSVQIDWRFAARINGVDPKRIRVGQQLKLITGPFHAIVNKSDFRLDLYLGDGPQQVYVRSFDVGLGQYNSTPEGLFRVKPRSKAVNPAWVNPRTGEAFDADDPQNPIGEHWIGLEGVDDSLRDVIGYGIHGTIEPESIGRETSMGCVRLLDDDIELLFEVLVEEASLVRIVP